MQPWNRRQLLQASGSVAAALPFTSAAWANEVAKEQADQLPHYFLQVIVPDGWDVSYMFDARSLAMTDAGTIANYLGEEPVVWEGANGQSTLATSIVDVLRPHAERFSILNGVLMAPSFDGHDQNMNQFLTGNPFGGESFVPHLNQVGKQTPLDFVKVGYIYAHITNEGAGVPLDPYSASVLVQKLRTSPSLTQKNPLFKFVQERTEKWGRGAGRFSAAALMMHQGLDKAPQLAKLVKAIEMSDDEELSALEKNLNMVGQLLMSGATRGAVISIRPTNGFLDTHAGEQAAASPPLLAEITGQIAAIFQYLASRAHDENSSLLDVTTVLVTSEFSRTMRQDGVAIDKTGTDHNPLNNTVLIGGKGIRGGHVVGESDFRSADETLSPVHSSFDPSHLKMMGKPFDFVKGRPRTEQPQTFDEADYLTINNVANTIYDLFHVDQETWRSISRDGPKAAVVRSILA